MDRSKLSIIIPALDEVQNLRVLIPHIRYTANSIESCEVIVVDASGNNEISGLSRDMNFILIKTGIRQRASQMNLGALHASGNLLFFLHADTLPPHNFDLYIRECLLKNHSACFRMMFYPDNSILSFYSYFTRFTHDIFHGGDSGLIIKSSTFEELRGFNEDMMIMEDYEFMQRIKRKYSFVVLDKSVETSARKYLTNGFIRLQWHYLIIQILYRSNFSQEKLVKYYKDHVH